MNQFKICYLAKWPDGKLVEPHSPYIPAYIEASSATEAVAMLKHELCGMIIDVTNVQQV